MLASPKTRRHPRMGELSLWDTANSSLFRCLSTAAPPPHLAGVLELIQDMDVGDRTDRDCKLYVSPYNFQSLSVRSPTSIPECTGTVRAQAPATALPGKLSEGIVGRTRKQMVGYGNPPPPVGWDPYKYFR